MADSILETLPLEMQQSIFKFLSTLDKVHVSFVSKSCAEAIFNEPNYKYEKELSLKNKMELEKFVSVLNDRHSKDGHFMLTEVAWIGPSEKITKTNIKYFDNSLVLIRINRLYKFSWIDKSILLLLLYQDFNKLNAKEIEKFSSYELCDLEREQEIINSLRIRLKNKLEHEEAIKILHSLFPENELVKSFFVVAPKHSYHLYSPALLINNRKKVSFNDPEFKEFWNFYQSLRPTITTHNLEEKNSIILSIYQDNLLTIEILDFDKFKSECENWKQNNQINRAYLSPKRH